MNILHLPELKKMKQLFLLFFLFLKISSFSQTPDGPCAYSKTDSLYSTILQEQRKIFVFNPGAGNNEQLDGKKTYPVIYLFDGEVYFEHVVAMTRELSRIGMMPEVIVVAIPNTDRASDLTPSHLDTPSDVEKTFPRYKTRRRPTGGSEHFISFMEKELIPHVDSTCHTAPYRLLIGHSLGALTAINILLNHSDLFHSYIAIDPVTYWDGFKFLKQSEADLATRKLEDKSLFLTFSNSRNPRTERIPSDKDTSLLEKTMNFCFQWKDALVRNKQTKLRWNWKYYKDDTHGTLPFISVYDGLRFIFNFYWLYVPDVYLPNERELLAFKADSVYTAHFKEVSNQMGYTVLPPVYEVNNLAYNFLSKKSVEMAYKLFQMNIKNYPDNWLVYDSMGDFYNEKGEKQKAIEYYTKALSFFNHPDTRAKIEKINKEK